MFPGTTYWPVAFIFLGSPYRRIGSGSTRPVQNSNQQVNSSVVVSDRYTKQTSALNTTVYTCVDSTGATAETCYESIDTNGMYNDTISEDDDDFVFEDGACCEDGSSNPVCCIVQLNKSFVLR